MVTPALLFCLSLLWGFPFPLDSVCIAQHYYIAHYLRKLITTLKFILNVSDGVAAVYISNASKHAEIEAFLTYKQLRNTMLIWNL